MMNQLLIDLLIDDIEDDLRRAQECAGESS